MGLIDRISGVRVAWVAVSGVVAIALGGAGGCSSGPTIVDEAFDGPGVSIGRGRDFWVVTVDAPTPGHDLDLDMTRERLGREQVFVTLREPDPAFMYAQVIAPMSVQTPVRGEDTVEVFARVVGHNASGEIEAGVYRPAARRGGSPSPE